MRSDAVVAKVKAVCDKMLARSKELSAARDKQLGEASDILNKAKTALEAAWHESNTIYSKAWDDYMRARAAMMEEYEKELREAEEGS